MDDKKTKEGCSRSQLFKANAFFKISVIVMSRKKRSKELVSGGLTISGVWKPDESPKTSLSFIQITARGYFSKTLYLLGSMQLSSFVPFDFTLQSCTQKV